MQRAGPSSLGTLMGSCRATNGCATTLFPSPSPIILFQRGRRTLFLPNFPAAHRETGSRHPARFYEENQYLARPISAFYIPHARFFSFAAKTTSWSADQSPYDVLEVQWNVDEDGIKAAYRRMVKLYHPDVYDESVELGEGETPEARFIKIQAAYELLVDKNERQQYDYDNRVNPLKASKAWMEWIVKKKKAFEQRGDMAVSAWAEQQQRELNLKARRLSKQKMDPEEERRILTREKQASAMNLESTLRRHTLVLKKRDIMRRKEQQTAQKKLVQQLLAAEGLELVDDSEDDEEKR